MDMYKYNSHFWKNTSIKNPERKAWVRGYFNYTIVIVQWEELR